MTGIRHTLICADCDVEESESIDVATKGCWVCGRAMLPGLRSFLLNAATYRSEDVEMDCE